jgi:Na+-transporting methylmalonyl-CoA/oxaloacetate decarboxylase gamma subunit
MGKWDFGITMMLVGMGGTLLTLWILSLLMRLLKRIFPIVKEDGTPEKSTS